MAKINNIIFETFTKLFETNKEKVLSMFAQLKTILASESTETKAMLDIYRRYVSGEKLDQKTIDKANEQFTDLIKSVGFLGVFALPGGMVAIPILIKIGKKLGIDILPKNFKDD
tara:strand:+ start:91 stop:432 length:342 start_codon:yes stop_codon:yes gene_type:complete